MFSYEYMDSRITKTTTINLDLPVGDYKVNVNQSLSNLDSESDPALLSLTFEMYPESMESLEEKTFYVLVEATGAYRVEHSEDIDSEYIGKALAKDLFPLLRASVLTVMASVGMPPYTLQQSILD